jgi:hypothetical protein
MPVIPATEEVELGGSLFKAMIGKKLVRPYLKNKPSMVAYTSVPSYMGGGGRRLSV